MIVLARRRPELECLLLVTVATVSGAAACGRSTTDAPVPPPRASVPDALEPSAAVVPPASVDGASAPPRSTGVLPEVDTDWCLEGWRGLDEGTCYLVPEGWLAGNTGARAPRRLLIYLSGIVPPVARSPQKENVQRIVAAAARRAGAVALLPRGRRGIGPRNAKDWWAWPTSASDYAAHASTMVSEWSAARVKLEAALGTFDRTYLAGSSSGAYFLTALALRGAVEMDGYAAASGGATGLGASRASAAKKRPFYVGYASGDGTNAGPKALGAFLRAAGWPVRIAEHPGGHGAREVYLDEAFELWDAWEPDAGAARRDDAQP